MTTQPTVRFSAIGLNHGHIYGQTKLLLRAGAELVLCSGAGAGGPVFSDLFASSAGYRGDGARRVQRETGCIYSVCFSEKFEVPAAVARKNVGSLVNLRFDRSRGGGCNINTR